MHLRSASVAARQAGVPPSALPRPKLLTTHASVHTPIFCGGGLAAQHLIHAALVTLSPFLPTLLHAQSLSSCAARSWRRAWTRSGG